jgi:1,4-dihydroxy-6-naphthoate synthase
MPTRQIRVAHSPDSDDAFMFYALSANKIQTGELEFKHVLSDIETLNQRALKGEYEVTAISFHAYAYLTDKYALLTSGASMGDRYGPLVISKIGMKPEDLKGKRVAVPGIRTTAFLILKLFEPDFSQIVVPFDQVFDTVKRGRADAGLIIHEGQLTYADLGLHKVIDLGEWWHEETQLPLPLGGNAIRKDLGPLLMAQVSDVLRQSIQYALEHHDEALDYAMQFAGDMRKDLADKFVGMYVNARTLNYGEAERKAVQLLLDMGHRKKIIDQPVKIEFAE